MLSKGIWVSLYTTPAVKDQLKHLREIIGLKDAWYRYGSRFTHSQNAMLLQSIAGVSPKRVPR